MADHPNTIRWMVGVHVPKRAKGIAVTMEQDVKTDEKADRDFIEQYSQKWGKGDPGIRSILEKKAQDMKGAIERELWKTLAGGTTTTTSTNTKDEVFTVEKLNAAMAAVRETGFQHDQMDHDIKALFARLGALEKENKELRQQVAGLEETIMTANPNYGTF